MCALWLGVRKRAEYGRGKEPVRPYSAVCLALGQVPDQENIVVRKVNAGASAYQDLAVRLHGHVPTR